ncbi:MAG: hypothetical protein AABY04_02100 [Candidatus Micrarchaeota archaeon]
MEFLDSRNIVLIAIGIVVIIWFLSFPDSKKKPKEVWEYRK